jgi:peroxiredoxin
MRFFAGLMLFSLLSVPDGISQQTELFGHANQFAGEYLVIREITNPISGNSKVVDTLRINDDGSFRQEIILQKPGWVFINSGIYRITMFVCPDYGYEIKLFSKSEKSESDIRNPFFKPVFAHIRVLSEYQLDDPENIVKLNDINSAIFRFDSLIAEKNHEMVGDMKNHQKIYPDSMIRSIEQDFLNDTSKYFSEYRRFRYGLIRINSRDVGLHYIYEKYLHTAPPKMNNPAWYDLFNEMFKEFLFFFSQTEDGKSINYLINRKQDLNALKDALLKHDAVPDKRLAELIIIKEIFNSYFKDYFYREALLILLDKIISEPEAEEHRRFAVEVKEYLTRLKVGELPPEFRLMDQDNRYVTIEDFKGKYVYLNFCTPDNYSCLKEFPFLKVIHDTHQKYLEIVTVMVTETPGNMKDFMEKNGYDWTALFYGNDDQLLQNYDVRAFPTCYLVGPEGKILRSQAALATEGLEQQLFRIMRSRGDL